MDAHDAFTKAVGSAIVGGEALLTRRRPPRSAAALPSPTARSWRPRRRSAASTSSRPATSTTRSRSPSGARPASAASRCGPVFDMVLEPSGTQGRARDRADVRACAASRTRTVASGPSCSPRRCASRATSTSPRSAPRTPTPRDRGLGERTASPSPGRLADDVARNARAERPAAPRREARHLPLLVEDESSGPDASSRRSRRIPDDRLRLVHLLPPGARRPPRSRSRCGCSAACPPPRSRARSWSPSRRWPPGSPGRRRRSPAARIPYRVPVGGRASPSGSTPSSRWSTCSSPPATPRPPATTLVRRDLVERSLRPGRMLRALLPADPAVAGPARAAAAHRRPAGHPHRLRRAAAAARGAGPRRAGTGPPSPRAPAGP